MLVQRVGQATSLCPRGRSLDDRGAQAGRGKVRLDAGDDGDDDRVGIFQEAGGQSAVGHDEESGTTRARFGRNSPTPVAGSRL